MKLGLRRRALQEPFFCSCSVTLFNQPPMIVEHDVSWAVAIRDTRTATEAERVEASRILAGLPSFPYTPARLGGPPDQATAFLEALLAWPSLPAEAVRLLATMALDEAGSSWVVSDVIGAVASHPNAPAEVLRSIHQRDLFPRCLASNPETPPDVLVQLAQSYDLKVRHWVLLNPS